jgi:uncharacterized protein
MVAEAIRNLPAVTVAGLFLVLVIGGSSKGALGIGLPLLSVPLSAQFLDLPVVVGLLTVPMIATNIGQSFEGGGTVAALRYLWPIMAALVLGTLVGVRLLIGMDRHLLYGIVGSALELLAAVMLYRPTMQMSRRTEQWAGPIVGLASGLLGGMSGLFGPLLTVYLVGLGLEPNRFVKYIATLFLAATVTLLVALRSAGSMSTMDLLFSAAAMIPIQLGMMLGTWLRGRTPPAIFRGAVLCVVALGGLDMLRRAFS